MAKRSPRYQFTDKAERDLEGIIGYTAQANTYLDGLETRTTPRGKSRPWNGTRDSIQGATQLPLRKPYSVLQKTRAGHRDSTSTPPAHGSGEASLIILFSRTSERERL